MYLSSLRVNIAPGSVRSASAAVRFYISTLTQFLVHFLLELQTHQISVRNMRSLLILQLQVCQFCFHLSVLCAQRTKSIFNNSTFVSYVKVARLRDRIREECTNYVLHNHHGLFMHQLLHLLSSKLAMNDQIVGHTEYKIHLRSDLRVYCPTSEFSVRPQNLVSDLRI